MGLRRCIKQSLGMHVAVLVAYEPLCLGGTGAFVSGRDGCLRQLVLPLIVEVRTHGVPALANYQILSEAINISPVNCESFEGPKAPLPLDRSLFHHRSGEPYRAGEVSMMLHEELCEDSTSITCRLL